MPNERAASSELTNSVALLVVDAQETFIQSLANPGRFLERCAFALDAARTLNILTLFTEQVPGKLGPTHPALLKRATNPKVFQKTSFSALSAPGIETYLRNNEIYHLLVCGLETPICIYQTGLQAVDEDIDVTFLADALGCRRVDDESLTLQALRGMGCQTLPTETVFYSLLSNANHPQFRAFSDLVKTFSSPGFDLKKHLAAPLQADSPKEESKPSRRGKNRRGRNSRQGDSKKPQETAAKPEGVAKESGGTPPAEPSQKPKAPSRSKRPPKKEAKAASKTDAAKPPPKKQAKKSTRKRAARKTPKKSASKSASAPEKGS